MDKKLVLPPIGHRIIKTTAAVFICLMIHMFSGYRGSASTAAVTAVICMQPYDSDSKAYAVDRILGTVIGSAWGFIFLLLIWTFPTLSQYKAAAYFIIAVFVMLAIYCTVLIKKPSTASLVAIVFLGMTVSFPEIGVSFFDALETLVYTVIGTVVAVLVNISHLPRRKHPEKLFFVRTMDVTPDRYVQIPSSVHITLDRLYGEGAKICLVSRWAPAFVISQMGLMDINIPMIVMDGAAMYDPQNNKYLDVAEIPKKNAEKLAEILHGLGTFCSFYTVRDRTLCIYRSGPVNEAEKKEYDKMKRSPYRNYMEGTYHEEDRIAFIRVIDDSAKIDELALRVKDALPTGMFRMELRQEAQFPDYKGLYFYDIAADVDTMKKKVIGLLNDKYETQLQPVDILPKITRYSPEHDAMLLLRRLKNSYEPVDLLSPFRKLARKRSK